MRFWGKPSSVVQRLTRYGCSALAPGLTSSSANEATTTVAKASQQKSFLWTVRQNMRLHCYHEPACKGTTIVQPPCRRRLPTNPRLASPIHSQQKAFDPTDRHAAACRGLRGRNSLLVDHDAAAADRLRVRIGDVVRRSVRVVIHHVARPGDLDPEFVHPSPTA